MLPNNPKKEIGALLSRLVRLGSEPEGSDWQKTLETFISTWLPTIFPTLYPPCLTPVFLELQRDHPGQMDRYLVHGNDYKAVRDAVGKAILESKPLAVEAALVKPEKLGASCHRGRLLQVVFPEMCKRSWYRTWGWWYGLKLLCLPGGQTRGRVLRG